MEQDIKDIIKVVKDITKEQGDYNPTFFIKADSGMTILEIPYEKGDEDKVIGILKELVQNAGSTLYYFAFTGWLVEAANDKSLQIELHRLAKKEEAGELSDKEKKQFIKKLIAAKLASQVRPSLHPDKKEILMVVRFDKSKGMDAFKMQITRAGKRIAFSRAEKLSGNGLSESRFNIWTTVQVDL